VAAPANVRIEVFGRDGWRRVAEVERRPQHPTTWSRNTIAIEPVEVTRLRVVFDHALPSFTGVTEMEIWSAR
jgi:hypothetical protein